MSITTDLSTAVGQIRFAIGDDVEGSGDLPNGDNFSDPQIAYSLNEVGGVILAAAAKLCGNLAQRWATLPQSFSADGLSVSRGDMVAKFTAMRDDFNAQAQGGNFGTVVLDRRDAFSVAWEQGGDSLLRESDSTYTE